MKEKENILRSHLLNKIVTDIEYYNINDNYFEFDPDSKWVIDGGIQIELGNDLISFGWNEMHQGIDYSLIDPIDKQFGELPFYALEAKKIQGIQSLIGKKITDVEFKWQYYQEYDEDFELKDEKIYTPVELKIKFADSEFIQLAVINFQIKKDPFEIVNAVYDLNGQLLISLDEKTEIINPIA